MPVVVVAPRSSMPNTSSSFDPPRLRFVRGVYCDASGGGLGPWAECHSPLRAFDHAECPRRESDFLAHMRTFLSGISDPSEAGPGRCRQWDPERCSLRRGLCVAGCTCLSLVHSKYNVGSVRSKPSSWRSETLSEPSTTVLGGCARLPPSRVLPEGLQTSNR